MKGLLRILRMLRFTLLGVLSFVFLVLTATGVLPLEHVWHVLMIPAYVVHLLFVIVAVQLFGAEGPPPGWYWIVSLPLRFAPFAFMDWVLWRFRVGVRPKWSGAS